MHCQDALFDYIHKNLTQPLRGPRTRSTATRASLLRDSDPSSAAASAGDADEAAERYSRIVASNIAALETVLEFIGKTPDVQKHAGYAGLITKLTPLLTQEVWRYARKDDAAIRTALLRLARALVLRLPGMPRDALFVILTHEYWCRARTVARG